MKYPIKKYVMNEELSWEERYKELEKHHMEETKFLTSYIEELGKIHLNEIFSQETVKILHEIIIKNLKEKSLL